MKIESNYEINKIYQDEFGRISGVFAVDKPEEKMSHDIVYDYRRKLNTKRVGHAGTLDPFASGLLIILAGKATKLSDKFLTMDKEYVAEIALGLTTETLDPEGNINKEKIINDEIKLDINNVKSILNSFKPEYEQSVPVYSSVKVQGNKLREVARKSDRFEIENTRIVFYKNNEIYKELDLPKKNVKIYEIELLESGYKDIKEFSLYKNFKEKLENASVEKLNYIKIRVLCSKGTYIRKLAEDIGEKLELPAMLIGLRRTKIGKIKL